MADEATCARQAPHLAEGKMAVTSRVWRICGGTRNFVGPHGVCVCATSSKRLHKHVAGTKHMTLMYCCKDTRVAAPIEIGVECVSSCWLKSRRICDHVARTGDDVAALLNVRSRLCQRVSNMDKVLRGSHWDTQPSTLQYFRSASS